MNCDKFKEHGLITVTKKYENPGAIKFAYELLIKYKYTFALIHVKKSYFIIRVAEPDDPEDIIYYTKENFNPDLIVEYYKKGELII